jgi:hypothetical protein
MIKRTLYFGKAKLSKSFKTFGKFILADVLMSIKEPAMIKRNSISEPRLRAVNLSNWWCACPKGKA